MVRPTDIARILRRERDPQRAAEMLVDAANAAGGEDNVSAVIVEAAPDDPPSQAVADPTSATPVAAAAGTEVRPDGREPDAVAFDGQGVDDHLPEEQLPTPIRLAPRGTTRRVFRFLIWMLPVIIVVGVAIGAVAWYARKAFFVTFDAGRVTMFRGRPGGVLGFDPTVERRTALRPSDLTEADQADVRAKKRFTDLRKAKVYISALQQKANERKLVAPTTTTTPSPPTTPVPNAPVGP
jgi:protein phosphatase